MTATLAFLPYITPYVLGCPNPMAQQAVVSAATEFCFRTNVIQVAATQDAVAGTSSYTITEASGTQFASIIAVAWEGAMLRPVAVGDVRLVQALRGAVGSAVMATGTPAEFYQRNPLDPVVYVYPEPVSTVTEGLYIKASFAPTPGAATVATDLFDNYVNEIAAGALAILQNMPDQEFTNPLAGGANRRKFEMAMASASRDARVGAVVTSQRIRPRRF